MTRLRRIWERLRFPLTVLILVGVILSDGGRLHASALWGTSEWMWAALAGIPVGLTGVIMAVVAIRRRRSGRESEGHRPVVGLTYSVGMLLVVAATHHKFGPQPRADSPLMVAALTAQMPLAFFIAVLSVMLNAGYGRPVRLFDRAPASEDPFRPGTAQDIRRSRALSSRRRHHNRRRP